MPVLGVVSPTHDERKATRAGRLPIWMPVEELLEKAARAESPKWSPWSYELIAAALSELEERGDNISTTALTAPCPRSVVLERKEDYVISMDELWRAFRGTMIHYVLEASARDDSVAEVRFFAKLLGDPISCKPDLITADGTMWDYKNTAEVPRYDYPYAGNQEQLNFNRWIVNNSHAWEKDDEPVALPFQPKLMQFKHLAIMYMDINGPKPLECTTTIQVPTAKGARNPTKAKKVPDVWDDEKILWGWKDYEGQEIPGMVDRYKAMRLALDSYPKFPAELAEFWGGDESWACPGYPYCPLKGKCVASRYPDGLVW